MYVCNLDSEETRGDIVLKKKQAIMMVSIAVVSFLIGTTLNVMTMATDGGNPFDKIWGEIHDLKDRVKILENAPLPGGFVSAPAYDSGWTNVATGQVKIFTHNLGTTEVFVYMIGRNGTEGKIHQRRYGGENTGSTFQGAFWFKLTGSEVKVRRLDDDVMSANTWEQVRVMIWKIEEALT